IVLSLVCKSSIQAQCWNHIDTRNNTSTAVREDGSLWAWGRNNYGQVGNGTTTSINIPVNIGTGDIWDLSAAGGAHILAKRSDGTLWGSGWNMYGQLGL